MPMRKFLKQEREKWQVGWKMRWAFGGPERPPEVFGGVEPSPEYFGWRGYSPTYFGGPDPSYQYFGWQDPGSVPFGARPQFPPVDIFEEGDKLYIIADIPGFKKDEIKIEIRPRELVISGERKEKVIDKVDDQHLYRFERYFDVFSRKIPLPYVVNPDTAKAKMEEGTLKIELEKAETEKGKEVPIE